MTTPPNPNCIGCPEPQNRLRRAEQTEATISERDRRIKELERGIGDCGIRAALSGKKDELQRELRSTEVDKGIAEIRRIGDRFDIEKIPDCKGPFVRELASDDNPSGYPVEERVCGLTANPTQTLVVPLPKD